MTESADREGMFTDPRLVDGHSVVTCTRCKITVDDTEAHERVHLGEDLPDRGETDGYEW